MKRNHLIMLTLAGYNLGAQWAVNNSLFNIFSSLLFVAVCWYIDGQTNNGN